MIEGTKPSLSLEMFRNIETTSFIVLRIWSSIPRGYKERNSVNIFNSFMTEVRII